jgi:hypothetical protein
MMLQLIERVCSTPGCGAIYVLRIPDSRGQLNAAPDLVTNCPPCRRAQSRYRPYAAATRAVELAYERERGLPAKDTTPDPLWQRRFR